ncbi:hypothetical protein EV426DRAFT_617972 [Tirmania nivea]|nr:hypothetical protein EV426DRAFT_617972 [Tirmania nivea]
MTSTPVDLAAAPLPGTEAPPDPPLPAQSNPPHPPTLNPSTPSINYLLIRRCYSQDRVLPYVGQLIKIRLDHPLDLGSGSLLSSSAPSRATPYNYHSALVTGFRPDIFSQTLVLTVLPILAYSASPDSAALVASFPKSEREKHIPMPNKVSVDTGSTPIEFGAPVRPFSINADRQEIDYLDRRQSWILVEEHIVRLPFTAVWKTFSPDVRFPIEDMQRLREYLITIQSNNNNVVVNRVKIPELHYPIDTDPWGFPGYSDLYTQECCGVIHEPEYDENEDENEDAQEEDEPEYSPLEFYRMIGTKNPEMIKWLEEEDVKVKKKKDEGILNWMMGVHEENAH